MLLLIVALAAQELALGNQVFSVLYAVKRAIVSLLKPSISTIGGFLIRAFKEASDSMSK